MLLPICANQSNYIAQALSLPCTPYCSQRKKSARKAEETCGGQGTTGEEAANASVHERADVEVQRQAPLDCEYKCFECPGFIWLGPIWTDIVLAHFLILQRELRISCPLIEKLNTQLLNAAPCHPSEPRSPPHLVTRRREHTLLAWAVRRNTGHLTVEIVGHRQRGQSASGVERAHSKCHKSSIIACYLS